MSASYDSTLPTDRDWVRFLTGDIDTDDPELQDEEIDAILSEESATGKALKYFAAATALSIQSASWASSGHGLISKTVGRLAKMWGMSGTTSEVIDARICWLRARGAFYLSERPYSFRMI